MAKFANFSIEKAEAILEKCGKDCDLSRGVGREGVYRMHTFGCSKSDLHDLLKDDVFADGNIILKDKDKNIIFQINPMCSGVPDYFNPEFV